MKCDKRHMLLYAVTDRAWTGKQTLYEQVEAALKGGVTCVQLREKELDETAFLQEAKELCALCRRYGVPFLVNDNVEIAIACGADGIHVGQEDLAAALGVSRQTIIAIENDKYNPTLELAMKLARYLETTVEELFQLEV